MANGKPQLAQFTVKKGPKGREVYEKTEDGLVRIYGARARHILACMDFEKKWTIRWRRFTGKLK